MRQMELLGLKWSDVDWGKRMIRVCRQLARNNNSFLMPKTDKGYRSIFLGDNTLQVLRDHSNAQFIQAKVYRECWQDRDLIFTNNKGGPVNYSSLVANHFKPLIKKTAVPAIRFHDKRHSNATILLHQGIPLVIVAARLGHSMEIQLKTCTHFITMAKDEAARLIDKIITPNEIKIGQE